MSFKHFSAVKTLFFIRREMKYLPERNLSFIAVLAYALIVCVVLNETIYAAGDEFAEKYRAYQSAVRAGKESFNKKDYQSSIAHYSKAIEMSPFEASSYYQRGVALYKTGKDKEAIEDFDKALIIDPRMMSVYGYRGLCREIMRRL